MTASLQKSLDAYATKIRTLRKRAAGDVIQIGRILLECRDLLEHGEWLPWLENEFGWSRRTAENFIRVAETFSDRWRDGKCANFANLEPSSLYLLSAKSTPPKAADRVLKLASKGPVPHKTVTQIVRESKPASDSKPARQKPAGDLKAAVWAIALASANERDLTGLDVDAVQDAIATLKQIVRRLHEQAAGNVIDLGAHRSEATGDAAAP